MSEHSEVHLPLPALARRLSAPVPVIRQERRALRIPPYVVALLGVATGGAAGLAFAGSGPWVLETGVSALCATGLGFALWQRGRVRDLRTWESEQTRAHARRVVALMESARTMTLQDSEMAVYQELRSHAVSLVPHDALMIGMFHDDGTFAGRYSAEGLIDGLNATATPAELSVLHGREPMLHSGTSQSLLDLTTGETALPLASVREAHLPIFAGRLLIAVVTVVRKRAGFTSEELDALAALCQQAGIALGRARLLAQLINAKREWERVFDATAEGIALVDADGQIRKMNTAFASFAGVSAGSAIGRDHHAVGSLNLKRGDGCPICESIRTGARTERMIENDRGGVLKLTLSPYPTGGAVLVAQDVSAETEVRLAEQRLLESEKFAAIGRLAAGVSHEVNNPLMGINGLATVLLNDPGALNEDSRELVGMIQRESRRAAQITRDLLSFVRAEEGPRTDVDLNEIVREVVELRGHACKIPGLSVSVELAGGLPPVRAIRSQIVQVLMNLVTNAEDAVEEASLKTIRIRTSTVGSRVIVRVEDSGSGIAEEHRARLFEPFFTTKAPGKGTGLGLSLSYTVVQRHGGILRADSPQGSGARFTIELPAAL